MLEEGPVDILWEGGSMCMSGGVGSIPRSDDGIGECSGNDRGVGGGMLDPGHGCGVGGGMLGVGDGCGVGEGMLGLGDGCGVDGEGSRVGITRGVATGEREPRPAGAMLMLGLSVMLGLSITTASGVAASSFGASGI